MCPSILNADRSNLHLEIERVKSSSDLLHLDVMDGLFVPNRTFDLKESQKIIRDSPIPVDVHLMIADPDIFAIEYARAGATSVTFHFEASHEPLQTLTKIQESGSRAALAIKPGTDFSEIQPLLDSLDMLLIMTVEPGFGGQGFIAETLPKIVMAREAIDKLSRDIWLQVDGGINELTIEKAATAGADTFVAGSAVYRDAQPSEALMRLRKLATSAKSLQ